MEGFIAGFAYGTTSVVVGQPLDTIKTKMQMLSSTQAMRHPSSLAVGHEIYIKEGIRGLYRGGTSLLLGGALIRSAQFGVNGLVLELFRTKLGGPTKSEDRIFKVIDPQVVVSGFCGGVARGIVEGPFEYVKVRRQVDMPWKMREMWNGAGATVLRNSFLFGSFVIYMDISRLYIELSPFWLGSICANLAWLTIWPLDVVKTQIQADPNNSKKSIGRILLTVIESGAIFRGLVPGLSRSFVANGLAMMAYKEVEKSLKEMRENTD